MDAEEKILKKMKTLKEKAKIDKCVEKYIENEKMKIEKINVIMSNTNYLEWLNQFTQDKEGFYDDDWLYFPEQIKDSDKENVEKLCLLYEGIAKYASLNHIHPLQCEFGNFYKIRLNEIGFEIGILSGQGAAFFCKKVSVENEQEFIDFNYIMTNKKQEQVNQINESLDSLANMVLTVYESGVPIESIVYTLENTIKEITSQKEDKVKLLTRN